jgi:hypothetical protein
MSHQGPPADRDGATISATCASRGWRRADLVVLSGRSLVAVRANTGVEAAWVYHMARVRQGGRLRGGVWPEAHLTALRREQ